MKKFMLAEHGTRPDKLSACPRCQSLNTKFCYFNNYNVKQPRHFCRECQRYWTAGGSLRNVPVGAGRRKHKISPPPPTPDSCSSNMYGIMRENGCDAEIYPIKGGPCVVSFNGFPACAGGQGQQQSGSSALMKYADSMVSYKSTFVQMGDKDVDLELGISKATQDKESNKSNGLFSHNYEELPPSDPRAKVDVVPGCTQGTEHEESVCCSTATTAVLTSSTADQAASEADYGASAWGPATIPPTVGMDILAAAWWGPLMWPWLLPFWLTGANGVHGVGNMPHNIDPKLIAHQLVDPAFTSALGAAMARTVSNADPAASFPQSWPFMWSPFAWSSHWNATNMSNAPSKQPTQDNQGSLCVPKTLRMRNRMKDAAYSSILSTLGVGPIPASPARNVLFNAFQPKVDVFQQKPDVAQSFGHWSSHCNPAAQVQSVAFQEQS